MFYLRFVLLVSIFVIFSCTNQPTKHWYKGNLHTHSYWSDGDEFPEVIMDWYKSHEYGFIALSDHNILAEGDKWVTIRPDSLYQKAFMNYLNTYGEEWVNYKNDSGQATVKLKTLAEYRGRFEEPDKFLIIKSEEITDHFENKPIHVNATNVQTLIEPQGGHSVADVLQNNIDQVIDQREATGMPMIPHINHPNFGYAIHLEDIIALHGERFFEVYNGHPLVHNMGDSIHMSTENMWDLINMAYIKNNKPIMYGLATDDSHHYHTKGHTWSNAGRGWIMVRTDSLNPKSIIKAMETGDFYASTGVELEAIAFDHNVLSVEIKEEPGVTYTITFKGCKKGKSSPEEFEVVEGTKASFKLTNEVLFVRCKITSSKLQDNHIEDLIYETAWTQPVVTD